MTCNSWQPTSVQSFLILCMRNRIAKTSEYLGISLLSPFAFRPSVTVSSPPTTSTRHLTIRSNPRFIGGAKPFMLSVLEGETIFKMLMLSLKRLTTLPSALVMVFWVNGRARSHVGPTPAGLEFKTTSWLNMLLWAADRLGRALNDELVAVNALEDGLRREAFDIVAELKQRSIEMSLISRDGSEPVGDVTEKLGIAPHTVRWRATPVDKQNHINSLLANPTLSGGTPHALFCDDGTNDSVALVQATIGVYMSGGTDIAKGATDVMLVSPNLGSLLLPMDWSRRLSGELS
ncbi:hypothetical protein GJ744_002784 [Endocarpon pusillum]|uniref:Uncharacterized protein n=1 Tax=Endocarpon pusillum TaxID=364733 RepID=A0A8H7ARX2_9EURO|nr:hypothetical protein GJ744_002784 [Endocarpon pusillum]